jgi:hypothetical protein
MTRKIILGLLGSGLLFIGVFLPLVRLPFIGNINYFQNGQGDGVIVLILAAISFILVFMERHDWHYVTGGLALAMILYTFVNIQFGLARSRADLHTELAGNPFRGLAEVAMQSIQMQWGWAVLLLGGLLLIASAAVWDEA